MKVRKYINSKYFNNIDYHEIKVINKEIGSNDRIIEKIVSITAISNLINWSFNKKNKVIIENEIEYKVLYLTQNDSRIYLAKGVSYFYDEIAVPKFVSGMSLELLIKKGLVEVGSNVQDVVSMKDKRNEIYLSSILMNWIYIKKIPRILLAIEIEKGNHYLYSADNYTSHLKQLTFESNEKFYNISFSFEGDEIFYIYNKNDKNVGIFKLNILTKQIFKIIDNVNIIKFKVFSKEKLIYEEKSGLNNNLCIVDIKTLKSTYFMKDIKYDIGELGCSNNSIYFSIKDNIQSKVLILNNKGERIGTILGEYRNIIFIEKNNTVIGLKDKHIHIINLKSMAIKKVKFNYINIVEYKLLSINNLIIKGEWNGIYQLISLNIETLEENLIFKIANEIGTYFIENENEIIISCREDNKWILKKIKLLDSVENLGGIVGNVINMIVRGA